jgi:hypothetical protein
MIVKIPTLIKPWLVAIGGGLTTYYFFGKNKSIKKKLRETKLELIEQQRTINRLRAELGRERNQRQEKEKEDEVK